MAIQPPPEFVRLVQVVTVEHNATATMMAEVLAPRADMKGHFHIPAVEQAVLNRSNVPSLWMPGLVHIRVGGPECIRASRASLLKAESVGLSKRAVGLHGNRTQVCYVTHAYDVWVTAKVGPANFVQLAELPDALERHDF